MTNQISKQVFPVTIDVENPKFWALLERMHQNMERLARANERGGVGGTLAGILAKLDNGVTFVRLMLLPAKHDALPANCRLEPVW